MEKKVFFITLSSVANKTAFIAPWAATGGRTPLKRARGPSVRTIVETHRKLFLYNSGWTWSRVLSVSVSWNFEKYISKEKKTISKLFFVKFFLNNYPSGWPEAVLTIPPTEPEINSRSSSLIFYNFYSLSKRKNLRKSSRFSRWQIFATCVNIYCNFQLILYSREQKYPARSWGLRWRFFWKIAPDV